MESGPRGAFVPLLLCALSLSSPTASGQEQDNEEPAAEEAIRTDLVDEIEVSATIARDREDAASFSNLVREEITASHHGQDLGVLLSDTPNAYAYSDAGNGVGYSYLRLRGFDQTRIAVNVNGVPLNTPEGRQVYYIDLADLAQSLSLIQVQRGPGTALYGSPAVAGVVNLETGNLETTDGGSVTLGGGSFGTYRMSVQYGGPLAGGRWAWSARVAHVRSDGYRNPSWTRHTLGQVAFQRFATDSIWKILLFGGPEETQLAYYGVPLEYLRGEISGDADRDRRVNFLKPGETDTFVQPQLQVHNDRRLKDGLFLRNTWYTIYGSGYYRQYSDLYEADPTGFEPDRPEFPSTTYSEAWRKRSIENLQVGWIPRISWDHRVGTLTAGAELLFHQGRHEGTIADGTLCTGSDPDPCSSTAPLVGNPLLYEYRNRKQTYTLFVRESLRPTQPVFVSFEVQATHHRFSMRDDEVRGYSWDGDYTFLMPRIGANWNISERWNLYGQASTGRSEPFFNNVWNPQEVFLDPTSLFARYDPLTKHLAEPDARPERLRAYELGLGFLGATSRFKANLYWMDFRDEFVFAGGIDEDGVPLTVNAARSVHAGVEIEGAVRLPGEIDLAGYLALTRDELLDHTIYSGRADRSTIPIDYSGNRVALFPDSLGRLRIARTFGRMRLDLGARRVGTIYTDNSEDERKSPDLRLAPGYVPKKLDPYTIVDLRASIDLSRMLGPRGRSLVVRIWIDNLLDDRYETMGYSYPLDPEYSSFYTEFFPGATRNAFVSLTFGF